MWPVRNPFGVLELQLIYGQIQDVAALGLLAAADPDRGDHFAHRSMIVSVVTVGCGARRGRGYTVSWVREGYEYLCYFAV